MQNAIITYLSKYVDLSEEFKKVIIENSIIKEFKKGTLLLKEGQYSKETFLVLKGCVRNYTIVNGIERTTHFYTEEHSVVPLAYNKNIPSEQYLECCEDTIVNVNSSEMESDMYDKYHEGEKVCRILSDVFLNQNLETFHDYVLHTPEERYLKLLNSRPDLFQRVPQFQIASFLGIKPESLSRIRKRIHTK